MTMPLFRDPLPRPELPLFDCHVHLGPSDSTELYYPTLTGEEYLALMESSGVERACAFPPLIEGGYREANRRLAQWAGSTGGRVLAFARLGGRHLPCTRWTPWTLRRKASSLWRLRASDLDRLEDFAGIKLLPHLDGLPPAAELERIDELRLPVLVHAGAHTPPWWIERTLVPRLRGPIILAHLGAFPCEEASLREAVELARRHDHVFLDTSGAWISEFIRFAVARVPEKILFGSDAPLAHPLVAWFHVASAVRDDKRLERIGRGTAQEVFSS